MDILLTNKQTEKQGIRNTNFEWLRILSMLMIIAYHSMRVDFGSAELSGGGILSASYLIGAYKVLCGSWGLLGVDLFLIISAWFLSDQQFRTKKVFHLVFQVFTWVTGYALLFIVYRIGFSHWSIMKTLEKLCTDVIGGFFQPLWSGYYWFVTSYFFMLLASPFINKLLNGLDRKMLSRLLIVFSFVPVYAQFSSGKVGDVFYFLYVYVLIGYVRKYGSTLIMKFAKLRYILLLMATLVFARVIAKLAEADNIALKLVRKVLINTFASTGRHSMIILLIAILIFFYTLNKKPTYNKSVNRIASCTLGVYLFHENSYFLPNMLNYIYSRAVSIGFLTMDMFFPFKHFLIILGTFAIGTVLELIRSIVFQKPFMKFVEKHFAAIIQKTDNWFNGFDVDEKTTMQVPVCEGSDNA